MAQINNSQVMQKLIDELSLYPAQDAIPNQLAEKIVPTFQVNTQDITVNVPSANIVRSAEDVSTAFATQTIYTTPATGKFYLTNVSLSYKHAALAANRGSIVVEATIDGTVRKIVELALLTNIAGQDAITLNLQNPIKIDPGTNIILNDWANGSGLDIPAAATIIGYTE